MAFQTTKNDTVVLDPGIGSAPMVIVYRGLGPERGPDYDYDTAEWILGEIQKAIPKETLSKIIFVAPDDYTKDLGTSVQQAKDLIKGSISSFSLCGFSRGGEPVYRNLASQPWKIVGLIDPVPPDWEPVKQGDKKGPRFDNSVVDRYASKIRCVYGVDHWGDRPAKGQPPTTKEEKNWVAVNEFHKHLKGLKVAMTDATDKQSHKEMPGVFFKKYVSSFL